MNNKCTINPQLIIKYSFKHHFTYKLLYHIMTYYDTDSKMVFLDKDNLILMYNSNKYSVCGAINELISADIISKKEHYKNQYNVNSKVFIKF